MSYIVHVHMLWAIAFSVPEMKTSQFLLTMGDVAGTVLFTLGGKRKCQVSCIHMHTHVCTCYVHVQCIYMYTHYLYMYKPAERDSTAWAIVSISYVDRAYICDEAQFSALNCFIGTCAIAQSLLQLLTKYSSSVQMEHLLSYMYVHQERSILSTTIL